MNRRRLLALVGSGTTAIAGCLGDREEATDDPSGTGPAGAGDEPDHSADRCPDTDVRPPDEFDSASLESFTTAFEDTFLRETRHHEEVVEVLSVSIAIEDDVARVDLWLYTDDSGWRGEITIHPPSTEIPEGLERVSTESIEIDEQVLETIDTVIETGERQTVTDPDSLETLSTAITTAVGHESQLRLEHAGEVLLVEHDAEAIDSHGDAYAGYRLTDETVYRTGDWPSSVDHAYDAPDDPIDVSEDAWTELDCWS